MKTKLTEGMTVRIAGSDCIKYDDSVGTVVALVEVAGDEWARIRFSESHVAAVKVDEVEIVEGEDQPPSPSPSLVDDEETAFEDVTEEVMEA